MRHVGGVAYGSYAHLNVISIKVITSLGRNILECAWSISKAQFEVSVLAHIAQQPVTLVGQRGIIDGNVFECASHRAS
jgi:hypothetical protein